MQLTDNQLDGVTAGAVAAALANALAQGPNNALAQTATATAAVVLDPEVYPSITIQLSKAIPTGVQAIAASVAAAN
jgi:hypothetical protein